MMNHKPLTKTRPWRRAAFLAAAIALLLNVGCGALDEFERQVVQDIQDNPVMLEHVGQIQTIDIDWVATGQEPGDDVFVFDVTGSKGSGTLTAECITIDSGREDVVAARLRLPSGEDLDIFAN